MLYRWLPIDEECNVPKYAHTILGVGAFVFNKETDEILVIKERYSYNKVTWKLPGGYVEPGILKLNLLYYNNVSYFIYICIYT